MTPEQERAHRALSFIIPRIESTKMRWVVTGGFACYVYDVERPITDIDIDLDTSKDSPVFQKFVADLQDCTTQPLEHFVDQNYDNYNFEITIGGQVIDICPIAEMKVFVKEAGQYENFYKDGFPPIEIVDFFGLSLPLLAKALIVKNKEMLVWKRERDTTDIAGLRTLM